MSMSAAEFIAVATTGDVSKVWYWIRSPSWGESSNIFANITQADMKRDIEDGSEIKEHFRQVIVAQVNNLRMTQINTCDKSRHVTTYRCPFYVCGLDSRSACSKISQIKNNAADHSWSRELLHYHDGHCSLTVPKVVLVDLMK